MVGHHSLEKYRIHKEVKPLAIISVAFLLIQALIGAAAVIGNKILTF